MHQQISLEQIKADKQGKEICPDCQGKTEVFTYTDEGEEFTGRRCTDRCGYWGGE